MKNLEAFKQQLTEGYTFKGDYITIGGAIYDNEPQQSCLINIPLKTLNRHGLIAGATGTGKTVTLQIIAEQLSAKGVPVLMMDLKGDLSGIATTGTINPKIEERHNAIGLAYEAQATPIELLTLSNEKGVKLRATVSEFGPVLFSKILDLNDTQGGIVAIAFKYADDKQLPLLDLKDFKSVLQFFTNEGKTDVQKEYGNISSTSISTILRKIIELESQGAEAFFGERSFDVTDLVRKEGEKGIVSIVRLTDIQDKPKLFSTFMLCLLAEIYHSFPEAGDLDKPKLCVFIDEAHLIFNEASAPLLNQIESIIKLIRSKGIGIFFCTQNPYDIPDVVLSQLGLKVQHALRAFTEKDRKAIKKTAENYPISEFYKTDELLTSLGIGQAIVSILNEKGIPTPLAAVHLRAPMSRMGILTEEDIKQVVSKSTILNKYNEEIDRESAYEILTKKITLASEKGETSSQNNTSKQTATTKEQPNIIEQLSKNTMVRQVGRTVFREVTRGLLGVLGLKDSNKKKGWF